MLFRVLTGRDGLVCLNNVEPQGELPSSQHHRHSDIVETSMTMLKESSLFATKISQSSELKKIPYRLCVVFKTLPVDF